MSQKVEGWNCSDVPYVHSRCIRGKYDLPPPKKRGNSHKASRKRLPGKKSDRLRNVRLRYYNLQSKVAPDAHTYMV